MEIYHHGVKGQKWGIRRYQNTDGSLTALGARHYGYANVTKHKDFKGKKYYNYQFTNKGIDHYLNDAGELTEHGKRATSFKNLDKDPNKDKTIVDEQKKRAGIINKNGNEYLSKDSIVKRITRDEETVDNKRKYVFLTEDDERKYLEDSIEFFGSNYVDTYKTKKNVKIASQKEAFDYIFNQIKDLKVSELSPKEYDKAIVPIVKKMKNKKISEIKDVYDKYSEYTGRWQTVLRNKNEWTPDIEFANRYTEAVNSMFYHAMASVDNKTMDDKIVKHFSKLGYDAIFDANDGLKYTDYPLIIINPQESMTRIKHEKW